MLSGSAQYLGGAAGAVGVGGDYDVDTGLELALLDTGHIVDAHTLHFLDAAVNVVDTGNGAAAREVQRLDIEGGRAVDTLEASYAGGTTAVLHYSHERISFADLKGRRGVAVQAEIADGE